MLHSPFALTVDIDDNVERMEGSTLLAIDLIAHRKQENEPLPRDEMEARN